MNLKYEQYLEVFGEINPKNFKHNKFFVLHRLDHFVEFGIHWTYYIFLHIYVDFKYNEKEKRIQFFIGIILL